MVSYALTTYSGDSSRVFVVGSSSGAMMATILAASYPDVFAAIAGFSGAPVGCLYGSSGSDPAHADPDCLAGNQTYTTTQWGDFVRDAYSSWSGSYPKTQFWHGTSDSLIGYGNFESLLEQWGDVHSVSYSSSVSNSPASPYTKLIYGDGSKLVGYSGSGIGHPVPVHSVTALQWFGIL
jgi:acetylxylan esterase